MGRSLVTLIDYGSGNLRSAAKALERAAREGGHAVEILVTDKPEAVVAAEHVVLPGVGAFADCYHGLEGHAGLIEALKDSVIARGRPLLGICVGMQLMATRGLEHGVTEGFGWIPGEVVPLIDRCVDAIDDARPDAALAALHKFVHYLGDLALSLEDGSERKPLPSAAVS